jgi:asparagine synthase (glutamine-hydrolysing)
MCGILGFVSSKQIPKKSFDSDLELLFHRGPDNSSSALETIEDNSIAFGHTRLSIIDLSESANQPFCIGDYTIIFNGEIYNYEALKPSLEKDGVIFKTHSDTETILQSYIKYGIEKTLDSLHGMFAFAILDKKEDKIILARDRVGIKPLYYLHDKENFIFSSEIKAIKKLSENDLNIDLDSSANYFYHKYVPEDKTIYKEIKAVESGEYIEFKLNDFSITKHRYWNIKRSSKEQDEKKIIDRVDELLNDSVKEHLVSDVPVSFALSGGLDSSLLIAMAKQYKEDIVGFTIKRDPNDIDWIYSQKIAKYLNVEQRITDFHDLNMEGEDKKLYEIYDQPIGCSSIFSTYLLYKKISKEFKVCISGDGGDEIFGGYMWYKRYMDMKNPNFKMLFDKGNLKQTIRDYLKYFKYDDVTRYKKIMLDRFEKNDIESILGENVNVEETDMYKKYISKIDSIQDMMYVDFFTFLRFALIRADLSSMAHSVENRVPFLDHSLVEYAYTIDPKLHHKNGELKYILKKVAERYLPKEYIYRPKRGFSAPINQIIPIKTGQEAMMYIYNKWKECHFDR